MKNKYLKILVFLTILFLIVNIVLFVLKIIGVILFWAIIIVAAVFAYKILPKIRKWKFGQLTYRKFFIVLNVLSINAPKNYLSFTDSIRRYSIFISEFYIIKTIY